MVVKLNAVGNIQWQRSIGGSGQDYFSTIIPTSDNAYLCIGTSSSNDGDVSGNHGGGGDYWAVKISNTGSILWSKCFGGSSLDLLSHGVLTYAGGFALIGETRSTDGNVSGNTAGVNGSTWLIRLDSTGALQWQKCYATISWATGPGIVEEANHNLLLGLHPGASSPDFSAFNGVDNNYVKVDKSNGVVIKKINTSLNKFTVGSCFVTTSRGYLSAYSGDVQYQLYSSEYDSYVQQLDTACNAIATMNTPWGSFSTTIDAYSSFSPARGIAALSDTSFIGAGMLWDDGTGPTGTYGGGSDAFVGVGRFTGSTYKYNYKKYGGSGYDVFTSIKVLPGDNDYIAVGYTSSNNFDVSGNHGGTDCWIVRLVGVNRIVGNVFIDFNGNRIKDGNDTAFSKIIVQSVKPGLTQYSVPYNGFFENDVDTGVYTSSVILTKPYYTVTPSLKTSTFTTYKNTDTVNFALTPIAGKRDYSVALNTSSSVHPGGLAGYRINYANNGTDTLTNKQLIFIKDRHMQLVSLPTGATASGDTLRWTLTGVLPGGSGQIGLSVKLDPIPNLNLLDTVTLRVYLDSTSDVLPADNSDLLRQVVTDGYDPNDKQENAGGFISPQDIAGGKRLTYTIRFQNTGNDTAYSIIVRDTLDARLDPSTIEMVDVSGAYQFNVVNGKYATWVFNNIKLVDSLHNEPLSHGYITYRIKPLSSVALGDTIHNGAGIYFDFNPVVNTATQITVVKVSGPPQPAVTGLQSNYCNNAGVQKGVITNLPAAGSGITSTVTLNSAVLAIAADSSFSFTPGTTSPGNDTIAVTYSNASGTATNKYYFTVTAAVTPDVNVSANAATIVNLTDPVTLTASNASGGGSAPLYSFAADRAFTNILQAESSSATYSVNTASLPMGYNWFYVRMRTSSTCYTAQTNIDSIKLYKLLIPGQPATSGAVSSYCSSGTAQKIKITNIPPAAYLSTTSVTLDGSTSLTVAADSSFSINPASLAAGNHSVVIAFTNTSGAGKDTVTFSIAQAVTPDVNISSNIGTVVNLTDNVILTASNASGGGSAPLYTFAKDKGITNILQTEGTGNTLTIAPSTLAVGSNWFYVRMRTSSSCYTAQTNVDSVQVNRRSITGIVDVDNPGQVITVYPNPFVQTININGLSAAKTYLISITGNSGQEVYRQQFGNSSVITINKATWLTGNYWLRIYDVKKNRRIGTSLLLKE